MRILRWIALPAAGMAAWYGVFIVGLLTYGPVERLLCPSGEFISGSCSNPTVERFMEGWIVLFVGMSAIAVVAATAWAAPARRDIGAWLAVIAGAPVAVSFAMMTDMYVAGAFAIVLGIATAVVIGTRARGRRTALSVGVP